MENKIDQLLDQFGKLSAATVTSESRIGQIEKSIEQLLKSEFERKDLAGVSDNEGKLGNTTGTASARSVRQRPVANNSEANVDIDHQEHFRAIKDALQRVKLPSDLKVDESRQGMKRSEMSKNFIITKCASYCETALKLLFTLDPGNPLSEDNLNDLVTILSANIRYLQEERGMLLVNSTMGPGVGTIFRQFKKNTSFFQSGFISAVDSSSSVTQCVAAASTKRSRKF